MSVVALKQTAVRRPGWAVPLQLARREGRRLLRSPIIWVGVLLSLVVFGFYTWHAAPVLHRDDIFTAGALLPLAAATLIVSNLAASRAARNATDELYDTTSSSPGLRTVGHLLSLGYAAAVGGAVIGAMFVYMFLDSPVGQPSAAELVTGPLIVILFGVVGIALARLNPHPALGPMAVVVAGALQYLLIQPIIGSNATNTTVENPSPWLAPWVPLSMTGQVPSELVIRPASWHLLYLGGLASLFIAFALTRSGSRKRMLPLFIVGTAAVVFGVIGQFTPVSASDRAALVALIEHPEEHQICEERHGVTYCAYPAYVGWIDRWAAPIEGALQRIPVDERPEDLTVRQNFGSYFEGPVDVPQEVLDKAVRYRQRGAPDDGPGTTLWTGIRWGRGATEGGFAIGLALAVSTEALDFPSSRREMLLTPGESKRFRETVVPLIDRRFRAKAVRMSKPKRREYSCTSSLQARTVAAMWIAAQSTPATRSAVISSAADNPYGLTIYDVEGKRYASYVGPFLPIYPEVPPPMWDRIQFGDAEFHYAARLLDRPDDEVAEVFAARWDELKDPTMLTESILDDLDLRPHVSVKEQMDALPEDVQLEMGRGMWSPWAYYVQSVPCF